MPYARLRLANGHKRPAVRPEDQPFIFEFFVILHWKNEKFNSKGAERAKYYLTKEYNLWTVRLRQFP